MAALRAAREQELLGFQAKEKHRAAEATRRLRLRKQAEPNAVG